MAAAAYDVLGDSVDITFSSGSGLIEIGAPGVTKASGSPRSPSCSASRTRTSSRSVTCPTTFRCSNGRGTGSPSPTPTSTALEAADEVTASNAEHGVAQVLETPASSRGSPTRPDAFTPFARDVGSSRTRVHKLLPDAWRTPDAHTPATHRRSASRPGNSPPLGQAGVDGVVLDLAVPRRSPGLDRDHRRARRRRSRNRER